MACNVTKTPVADGSRLKLKLKVVLEDGTTKKLVDPARLTQSAIGIAY